MSDSLFFMQRYWGSDEDDNSEQDDSQCDFDILLPKQKEGNSTVCEIIEIDRDIEILEKSPEIESSVYCEGNGLKTNNGNSEKTSKKKKKLHNKKEQSILGNKTGLDNLSETLDELDFIKKSPENTALNINLNKVKKQKLQQPNEDHVKVSNPDLPVSQKFNNKSEISKHNSETKQQIERKKKTSKEPNDVLKEDDIPPISNKHEILEEIFRPLGKVTRPEHSKIRLNKPSWLSNPTYIEVDLKKEETPISKLDYLDSNSKSNLLAAGINYMFPVQLSVIPWLLQSKELSLLKRPSDICVSAPTGSGKTLAFVLPIVQSLKDRIVCSIRALIVLPVNELAIQVYKVFETFIRGTDLKVALLTGQKSFATEQNILVKISGNKIQSLVDIIVTTPGRVTDHILRTKGFCLKRLRYLVIDEADRMMEEIQQGWLKQVEEAVFLDCRSPNCVCNSEKRLLLEPTSAYNFGFVCQPLQKLLYSATLTHNPEQLHTLSLYKPKLFTTNSPYISEDFTSRKCILPQNLKMMQVICDAGIKPLVVCHLIKKHNFKRVLCFTQSVERAHRLHLILEEIKLFEVREISSFNRAVQRKIVIEQFASGKVNVLICSDLVARGIDIDDIDCVISYDVPQLVKLYVHRIGRTARAGKSGIAITLLSMGQVFQFKKILNSAGIALPEILVVTEEDLKPFINSYTEALTTADTKLKNERSTSSSKPSKKKKRKEDKI